MTDRERRILTLLAKIAIRLVEKQKNKLPSYNNSDKNNTLQK